MNDRRRQIADRWQRAVDDVHQAAVQAGRSPDCVRIVGVSKYVDTETTLMLIEAGCSELGESRPQQLAKKAEAISGFPTLRWHLVGHLQSNKVRRTVHFADTIHSIDSVDLLRRVDRAAGELGKSPQLFIEINISGDESKHGFAAEEAVRQAADFFQTEHAHVVGLMAMAGLEADSAESRRQFAALRNLRDRIVAETGKSLPELSMGMSGDFREAIAEGSTLVRIGSRLFDS